MQPVSRSVSEAGTINFETAVSCTEKATKAYWDVGMALAIRLFVISTSSDLHHGGMSGGNFSDSQSKGFVLQQCDNATTGL